MPTDRSTRRSSEEISLLRLANAGLAQRRLLILLPLACAAGIVAFTLLTPRLYVAGASFVAQEEEGALRRVSALAAQLGFDLPSVGTPESPRFYGDLLESRRILEPVVTHPYTIGSRSLGDATEATLLELFGASAGNQADSIRGAVERLRRKIRVRTDAETGVVRYTVQERRPELAEQIAVQVLASLTAFNSDVRQSRAAAERAFLEGRLHEAEREVAGREAHLEAFLRENRRYENSPELTFQFDRLRRDLDFQRQLQARLGEAYEQARIEEVRTTPVFTVIDLPDGSVRPRETRWAVRILLGALAGFVLALFVATGREFGGGHPEGADETDELERFRSLQADARDELVRLWRRVRQAPLGQAERHAGRDPGGGVT